MRDQKEKSDDTMFPIAISTAKRMVPNINAYNERIGTAHSQRNAVHAILLTFVVQLLFGISSGIGDS
jgi:hypothetical protein